MSAEHVRDFVEEVTIRLLQGHDICMLDSESLIKVTKLNDAGFQFAFRWVEQNIALYHYVAWLANGRELPRL